MSFIVKLFFFAMLVAMVMAQLPDLSALPIPAGVIPEGVIPGGSGAGGAEGGEEAAAERVHKQKMF
jgi:hypothetical protein